MSQKQIMWIDLLNEKFDSSTTKTPQYLAFCRTFKKQFKNLLNETFNTKNIEISKPNHFDAHGFFELQNGNIYYFSIGDLRMDKTFLIRTAKSFKDYTGGANCYCRLDDIEIFMNDLKSIVDNSEIDKNLYGFEHKKCGTGFYMATKQEAKDSNCKVCNKSFFEDSEN